MEFIKYIFEHSSISSTLFIWILMNTSINILIFNIYIIPKIEKKVGQKLIYESQYYLLTHKMHPLAGKYIGQATEIMIYIFTYYMLWKFGKYGWKINHVEPTYALSKVNYKIETASKLEVFLTFCFSFNVVLIFACVILNYYGI